jgi:hypothetical protein
VLYGISALLSTTFMFSLIFIGLKLGMP